MAKKEKEDKTLSGANFDLASFDATIQTGFVDMFALEQQIAAKEAEHLKPLKDKLKKARRSMKADSGIDLKRLNAAYKLYKLEKEDDALEDEADRLRAEDERRALFSSLAKGQMLKLFDDADGGYIPQSVKDAEEARKDEAAAE